jgi:hypothetical protein
MERNRGMFGYEGEGFEEIPESPREHSVEVDPARGWNIGSADDRGESRPVDESNESGGE